mmetsp:Transcript_46646/g.110920  ORF Transcript_46646/g.110920 Transcript_46646/m.110920 type:complete len:226 (-) Transcript_46646:26-703(-)
MVCAPEWSRGDGQCPHGTRIGLPGSDFTYPSQPTLVESIAVAYSAMPFMITTLLLVVLLTKRGLQEFTLLLLCPVIVDTFVTIARIFVLEPRPEGSCLLSCGAPSAHSMKAIGLLTVLLLEVATRGAGGKEKLVGCMILTLLLGPVPWAGIVLKDHTLSQTFNSCILGGVLGLGYFACLRKLVLTRAVELANKLYLHDNYTPSKSLEYKRLGTDESELAAFDDDI